MISTLTILLSIWEGLVHWLSERYPDALVFIVFGIVVWFLTSRWDRFYARFTKTEKQCNNVRNDLIPDLHFKYKTIDKKLDNLALAVNNISIFLSTTQKKFSAIFTTKSPRELNTFGKNILVDIGGKKYIDENADELIAAMKSRGPKSGLDVESYSAILLIERSGDDNFIPIKNHIFQNPVYRKNGVELELSMTFVLQILGIYLRNKYLEKYPDLKKRTGEISRERLN